MLTLIINNTQENHLLEYDGQLLGCFVLFFKHPTKIQCLQPDK